MTTAPKTIYLKDYTPSVFTIDAVTLTVDITKAVTTVTNISTYRRNPKSTDTSTTLLLDGKNMELVSLEIDETPVTASQYTVSEHHLEIRDVPENFTLKTVVHITPQNNKQLSGLYMSDGIYCTQNEPEGFRRITYHLDRPDILSRFTTTIRADKDTYPTLLSNGNLIHTEEIGEKLINTWEDPIPKPCYLFALVAGNLVRTEDSFTTISGKTIPLHIYTEAKDANRVDHAMESLILAMKWDEERFGREYDLDLYMIVAVDAFNSGAMENKGLNIFNTAAILADPQTATDNDYKYIERVIAHEYFHNWTGNRITCRDWFQLTLKEGLTVFRDAEFTSDLHDKDVKIIEDASYMKESQFAEDMSPMAHPIQPQSFVQIENFYTRTVYEKGSEVIRMLQTFLGREGFRKGMDVYFELFDGQAVTTEDFVSAMEKGSGRDFSQFQKSWYTQAGTPVIQYSGEYNSDEQTYTLILSQSCPYPEKKNFLPYHFPLQIGLLDASGKDFDLILNGKHNTTGLIEVTQESETFVFEDISQQPIPSLLRDFSAPVRLQGDATLTDDIFLFRHDSNMFNRFEAGQRVAILMITKLMHKKQETIPAEVLATYRANLMDESLSPVVRARMMQIPSLFPIVSQFQTYEYTQAHRARKQYLQLLADFLEQDLLHIYTALSTDAPYSKTMPEMNRRSLRNTCLGLLSSGSEKHITKIHQQFSTADNMTDRMCALSLLQKNKSPEKEQATEEFYAQWKDNALVMNKWFAVQASSCVDDVREIVQKLENNPAFDLKNPNKIRSLLGCFGRNYAAFHDSSGASYQYIADKVLEIDRFNGKAAGSLAQAFNQYVHLSPTLQSKMHPQLERIRNTEGISDILFEVIDAILKSGK